MTPTARPGAKAQSSTGLISPPDKLTTLLDDPRGGIRDPQVHYDGRRILFSYRKGGTENYLLYEINADGSGLRQLTDGAYDDFEPTYLPDGDIVFVSTPLQALGELLAHPGGGAAPLRRRRRQHPRHLQQQRAGQHALAAAGRAHPLHALGIRGPQPGRLPSSLDRQSRTAPPR